jgi:AbrB family looped-hinge helix DNA binding protein
MIVGKISKKGQIVIPKEIRKQLNIHPEDVLMFHVQVDKIIIEKVKENPEETMIDILEKSKPIGNSLEFQKRIRDEWT